MSAYRPRIQWLQGTEVRHTTHSEMFALEEIYGFGKAFADAAAANGAVTFETTRGEWLTLPARSITEIRYQRVEVADARQPETTTATTEQGHCCTEGSPCRDGAATKAERKCPRGCLCDDEAPDPTYAERTCPCWPGQCTCTELIEVQGLPFIKGPLHAPHVTDPDQT